MGAESRCGAHFGNQSSWSTSANGQGIDDVIVC